MKPAPPTMMKLCPWESDTGGILQLLHGPRPAAAKNGAVVYLVLSSGGRRAFSEYAATSPTAASETNAATRQRTAARRRHIQATAAPNSPHSTGAMNCR